MVERFQERERSGSRREDACRSATSPAPGLTHDFRNMLQLATSSIRVARRQLLERSQSAVDLTLGDALDALERANLLAHRLTSRNLEEGNLEPVLLQLVVPELRTLLSCALGDDISLESLVAENLPPVFCDRLQLENVLLNLAVNARHAMPDGGCLFVEAVHCGRGDHRACVVLSVVDTGCGMPPDIAKAAFQPFFSTRLAEGGTGLGLFNVRSFVEKLGGSIQLSSAENRGTRVVLHLPAMDRASRRG